MHVYVQHFIYALFPLLKNAHVKITILKQYKDVVRLSKYYKHQKWHEIHDP